MRNTQPGFTLMEVLIALFILSLLTMMAVSGLNAILRAQSHQVDAAHELQAWQFTYTWLDQDLSQYVAREVLDSQGEPLPALMLSSDLNLSRLGLPGEILLAVTRGGITDPKNKSSLQRVAYTLNNKELIRYTYPVLDVAGVTRPISQVLLQNVVNMRLRYLSDQGTYYQNWRDYTGEALTPMAIEFQITHENGHNITWLFPITSGGMKNEESTTTTTQ